MSAAPVTEANRDEATRWIASRPSNVSHQIDSLAQAFADSEARVVEAVKQTWLDEIVMLRAEVERLTRRLHPDPGWSDKIDELEFTLELLRARAEKAEAELVALKALYSGAVEGRAVLLQQIATGVSRTEHNETIAELVAERRRTDFLLEKCGLTERATVDAAIAKELGWTTRAVPDEWSSGEPSEVVIWVAPDGTSWNLPKFTSDLNAIHQAIMTRIVRGKSIAQYMSNEHLFEAKLCAISEREQVPVWHFTAELYAEAFLATVGTTRPAEIATNATPPETNP